MRSNSYGARRGLAPECQFELALLQSKAARALGTNPGSPFSIRLTRSLKVNLLSAESVGRALASPRLQEMGEQRFTRELTRKLPAESGQNLDYVKIETVAFLGSGASKLAALEVHHEVLDAEQDELHLRLSEMAGYDCSVPLFQYLPFGVTDEDHADEITRAIEDVLPTSLKLGPLVCGSAPGFRS